MLHKLQFETLLLLRMKFRHDEASNGEEGGGHCRLDIGVEKELEKVGVLKGEWGVEKGQFDQDDLDIGTDGGEMV